MEGGIAGLRQRLGGMSDPLQSENRAAAEFTTLFQILFSDIGDALAVAGGRPLCLLSPLSSPFPISGY